MGVKVDWDKATYTVVFSR
ncbi:hypothetical protein [Syntrophomonas palmitatica]